MSEEAIQEIIGQGLTGPSFCRSLLGPQRAEILAKFELTLEEKLTLLAAPGTSFQAFAGHVDRFLETNRIPRADRSNPKDLRSPF